MYIGNEIMLVTYVQTYGKNNTYYGIIFNGELDDVSSYFTEDKTPVDFQGKEVQIRPGDIIPSYSNGLGKMESSFNSQTQQQRINNIITLFEGITKCAKQKVPTFFENGTFGKDQQKYVWQYLHATAALGGALSSLNFNENRKVELSAKGVCLKYLLDRVSSVSSGLDKKLSSREDYFLAENLLEAIKILNQAPESCFKFSNPQPECDEEDHNDYLLVTDRNEDGTVNGIMLSNLLGKGSGQGNMSFVRSVPSVGGFAVIGELIGVEEVDGEKVINKSGVSAKSAEERFGNLYLVNNLIFEHYVQREKKDFSNSVYNAQLAIARGIVKMMYDQANYGFDDNEWDNKQRVVYAATAEILKNDYLQTKKNANVEYICKLNEKVNLTKPIVDLPKKAYVGSDKKQTTLDMF